MKSVIRFLAVSPVVCAPALAQQYFDGTFLDSTWSLTKVLDTTPGADALYSGIRGSGGNPGDCRLVAHNWQVVPQGVQIAMAHAKKSIEHDPGVLGSLLSLEVSFDARCDTAPYVSAMGFGPLLVQEGKYYSVPGDAAVAGGGWIHFARSLHATDWTEIGGNAKPDLTDGAPPVLLGFISSNGGSGTTARLQATGKVDNFLVRFVRSCPADLNFDGLVEDADFSIFVVAYDTLDCADPAMPAGCPADLNADALVDDADFSIFVVAYDALVCP